MHDRVPPEVLLHHHLSLEGVESQRCQDALSTQGLSPSSSEAQEGRGDLAVLWLDLANVYSSISHKLMEVPWVRHHVPGKIRHLILDYYNRFSLRVTSGSTKSAWHQLEKGIITGCTISAILFALAMNMLVKSEVECRGPLTKSGVQQLPIRAFMDDLVKRIPRSFSVAHESPRA